jgi:hypothetical protein
VFLQFHTVGKGRSRYSGQSGLTSIFNNLLTAYSLSTFDYDTTRLHASQ